MGREISGHKFFVLNPLHKLNTKALSMNLIALETLGYVLNSLFDPQPNSFREEK